jgi:hypothetical protein
VLLPARGELANDCLDRGGGGLRGSHAASMHELFHKNSRSRVYEHVSALSYELM